MTISEKVSYLKGLAEGLALDTEGSKEGKLISVMIGILEEIGLSLEDIEENANDLSEAVDALSDDLSDMEDFVFGEEDDEEDFFEVKCPACGASVDIDSDVLEAGRVECPGCGEMFAVDLTDEEDTEGKE